MGFRHINPAISVSILTKITKLKIKIGTLLLTYPKFNDLISLLTYSPLFEYYDRKMSHGGEANEKC